MILKIKYLIGIIYISYLNIKSKTKIDDNYKVFLYHLPKCILCLTENKLFISISLNASIEKLIKLLNFINYEYHYKLKH